MKTFLLLSLFALFGLSVAQNCGIAGITGDVVEMDPISELTAGNVLVWRGDTFNVTGAASISHPHVKYLKGLRYSARYEYVSEDIFSDFLKVEKNSTLTRSVLFTCSDGQQRPYTFLLPVIDENDSPPIFNFAQYNVTVSRSEAGTEPVNANMIVSDGDYEYENANMRIRSSNPGVIPFVDPQWTSPDPSPFVYKVDVIVSRNLAVGNHNVVFTADDGEHTATANLALVVTA